MTEWHSPAAYVEELPSRPVAVRHDDPVWAQVPVRRVPAYVESSLRHGLQWTVFEPDVPATWALVREQAESFLDGLWRSGTLQGDQPEVAYFVRCDASTMTQDDLDNGRLVVLVGVATLKPAEFVVFRIGLWTSV